MPEIVERNESRWRVYHLVSPLHLERWQEYNYSDKEKIQKGYRNQVRFTTLIEEIKECPTNATTS